MAVMTFGGGAADVVTDAAGNVLAGVTLQVWTAQAGGVRLDPVEQRQADGSWRQVSMVESLGAAPVVLRVDTAVPAVWLRTAGGGAYRLPRWEGPSWQEITGKPATLGDDPLATRPAVDFAAESQRAAMPMIMSFSNTAMRPFIATSIDGGSSFAPVPQALPFVEPDPAMGARDPSVVRWRGLYVMAYTRTRLADYLGDNNSWALATSRDLLSWTKVADVNPGIAGLNRCWAPDLMVDPATGRLWCWWAGGTSGMAQFTQYAQSLGPRDAWTAWTAPQAVGSTPTPKAIDMTVRPLATGGYVAVVKDEVAAQLYRMTAPYPDGPWTRDPSPLPTGGPNAPVEGPALTRLPTGGWRLYFDRYMVDQLAYMDTTSPDASGPWSAPATLTGMPANSRHVSVLQLTPGEVAGLWASPIDITAQLTKPGGSIVSSWSAQRVGRQVTVTFTIAGNGQSYGAWATVPMLTVPAGLRPSADAGSPLIWLREWAITVSASGALNAQTNAAASLPAGSYFGSITWTI